MSAHWRNEFSYTDLRLPGSLGVLGLMSCPGARGASAGGDNPLDILSRDLSKICAHQVRMVVSCLEANELPVDPAHYWELYQREAICWELVPIADYCSPTSHHDKLLMAFFETVSVRLQLGEKVAFHCAAGLGRTGTVAARYLIHKGLSPEEAISYVRRNYDSRAIETQEQEQYLYACAAA